MSYLFLTVCISTYDVCLSYLTITATGDSLLQVIFSDEMLAIGREGTFIEC